MLQFLQSSVIPFSFAKPRAIPAKLPHNPGLTVSSRESGRDYFFVNELV